MLSSHAVRILRFLSHQTDWIYMNPIQKQFPDLDDIAFRALVDDGYVKAIVPEGELPEFDDCVEITYPQQYHISDKGLAYLENLVFTKQTRFQAWAALAISFIALVISALALFST